MITKIAYNKYTKNTYIYKTVNFAIASSLANHV